MASGKLGRKIQNVWMVTREYEGLAGAGGVKDMCRQLAESLAKARCAVSVILPRYGFMEPAALGFTALNAALTVDMSYAHEERRETVEFWHRQQHGVTLYLVEVARFREKQGIYTYTAAEEAADPTHRQGTAYFDYFAMNVLLQKAALALIVSLAERPDVIHCQDGHTAILPAMLREIEGFRHYFRTTGVVVTIHNAGYGYHQEVGDLPFAKAICGLPMPVIEASLLDGRFDPFLAAARYAVLNTVSENYARELQETDDDGLTGWLGHRLLADGIRLTGVTNGINPADFDPRHPKKLGLPAAYDPGRGDLIGKQRCKAALLHEISAHRLDVIGQIGILAAASDQPLFTMISRLTAQKGVDLLIPALDDLLARDHGFQALIMGDGDPALENGLLELATGRHHGRVCLLRGYHPQLANRVYAAGDFFLVPSRYEPCGLTDFIAQLFGNIPVVRHTGGLIKVEDGVTGFAFQEHTAGALLVAMQRAIRVFREKPAAITTMQQAAVQRIADRYTWDKVRQQYLALYQAAPTLTSRV
ncbi:MAG: glycogen synthase [Deltaproteobacteria bacterium RIFOXYD12_FULL_57_12]|nr:MAG: glycogen synthase [Deltaproteobacteria bacterium RIFOXYD12_FULL_57_12]